MFCCAYQVAADELISNAGVSEKKTSESDVVLVPDRLVVLTFDDSAITHATHVGPLLKKFGFGATFFITEGFNFTTNKQAYMTWEQIQELHKAGFEIGNHTRRHTAVSRQTPAETDSDVAHIEEQCVKHDIPKPTSFCYPGYATSDAAVMVLKERGYRFARAGGGRAFDPAKDNPLLLPQAFDGKPDSTFEQFVTATAMAKDGRIAVMTFHGIPDAPHPWVSTTPVMLKRYLQHLANEKCTVVALRELVKYVPATSAMQADTEVGLCSREPEQRGSAP
ncbi:MAG: polysaccharide deacetylase family protein [Fuerstiella sp.]